MSEEGAGRVLDRKVQAARRAIEARGMSAEKAFRRALARTAEEAWNLALIARDVTIAGADQDRTETALGRGDLIVLLDGPAGATGFAALDRAAVTALVEVQTLGIVTDMELDERRLTPTDAAVAAPLLDGTLQRLGGYLSEDPAAPPAADYRFAAMVESARIVSNLLGAARYRLFEAALDMGGGLRRGRIVLALPEPGGAARREPAPGRAPRHRDLMLGLNAPLDAVLCRLRMPVSAAEALAVGDVIPLPADAMGRLELVANGRHRLVAGALGQVNGLRAVRVTERTGAGRAVGEAPPPVEEGAPPERAATPVARASPPPSPEPGAGPSPDGFDGLPDLPELPPLEFDQVPDASDTALPEAAPGRSSTG